MSMSAYLIIATYAALLAWLVYRGQKSNWNTGATRAMVWGSAPAVLAVAIGLGVYLGGSADAAPQAKADELAGVDPNATREKLRELSAVLVSADKKGDAQLAQTVLNHAVALQVTIDHQPGEKKSALRNCALAAQHLASGADFIARGGRWQNEDQFQAAAGDCRT